MKLNRIAVVGLALAGSIGVAGLTYAAGLFQGLPIVGSATYCAGATATATGTLTGAQTGCPNQVPAGPTVVTGNEKVPADTFLTGGAAPQSVYVPMASLNALPMNVFAVTPAIPPATNVSATNISGGVVFNSTVTITQANVTLPSAPIDGQQYAISANRTITALVVAAGGTGITIAGNSNPTAMTASTTAPQGYRFLYNAATTSWLRLQ